MYQPRLFHLGQFHQDDTTMFRSKNKFKSFRYSCTVFTIISDFVRLNICLFKYCANLWLTDSWQPCIACHLCKLIEKKSEQAARNLLNDFEATKTILFTWIIFFMNCKTSKIKWIKYLNINSYPLGLFLNFEYDFGVRPDECFL